MLCVIGLVASSTKSKKLKILRRDVIRTLMMPKIMWGMIFIHLKKNQMKTLDGILRSFLCGMTGMHSKASFTAMRFLIGIPPPMAEVHYLRLVWHRIFCCGCIKDREDLTSYMMQLDIFMAKHATARVISLTACGKEVMKKIGCGRTLDTWNDFTSLLLWAREQRDSPIGSRVTQIENLENLFSIRSPYAMTTLSLHKFGLEEYADPAKVQRVSEIKWKTVVRERIDRFYFDRDVEELTKRGKECPMMHIKSLQFSGYGEELSKVLESKVDFNWRNEAENKTLLNILIGSNEQLWTAKEDRGQGMEVRICRECGSDIQSSTVIAHLLFECAVIKSATKNVMDGDNMQAISLSKIIKWADGYTALQKSKTESP